MLTSIMDSKWKRGVEIACTRLLVEIGVVEHIHLPYAIPYMNYVLSWKDHLPVKTVLIGQNPYPKNIYPTLGAALSYDPDIEPVPPRSVKALAEDLYEYDKTPMFQTVKCIQNSWHLLKNGTIMINETVLSMIYPEIKSNCGPTREMEAQCIALQQVFIASYFMGQKDFAIVAMGESAALMMDTLKKWCPSDAMKIKAIGCRNPAARERGDMPSRAFTLKQTAASKIISSEVAWYHTMPPKQDYKSKRLEQTETSLQESFSAVNASKNSTKTELEALSERLTELGKDSTLMSSLISSIDSTKHSMTAYTNSIKSHQMQLIQYVNAAKSAIPINSQGSDTASNISRHKDIQKLAVKNPPRKKVPMEVERVEPMDVPNIKSELENTLEKTVKNKTPHSKLRMEVSTVTPSEEVVPNVVPSTSTETPTKKKGSKTVTPEEAVHVMAFANWFKNNVQEDAVYAGILHTVADDKSIGTTTVATKVIRYIRTRKREDATYDAHAELQKNESASYVWSTELKNTLLKKD